MHTPINQPRSRRQIFKTATIAAAALAGDTPALAQRSRAQVSAASGAEDPRTRLESMIFGYELTQMICVAAKLGIADHLKQAPRTADDLAKATATHEDALYRLLRTLAGFGIFAEEDGRRFRLTPMADLLRPDVPGSMHFAAQLPGAWLWPSYGNLMHSIKTGEAAFDQVFGKNVWAWLAENPGENQLGGRLMTELTTQASRALLSAYDFGRFRTIVDVGGGQGALLSAILNQNARARGVLLELPRQIELAKQVIGPGVASRIELVPGDFFKAVPSGGDLYILKDIIHDWNESQSQEILRACRQAMNGRGVLLIIEQVVCGPNQQCRGKMTDVRMLAVLGGRNRTEQEYADILKSTGFEMTRIVATGGPDIIEAVPR